MSDTNNTAAGWNEAAGAIGAPKRETPDPAVVDAMVTAAAAPATPAAAQTPAPLSAQDELIARITAEETERILREEIRSNLVAQQAQRAIAAQALPETETTDWRGFPKKYTRIIVHEGAGVNDLTYAPVSVNGHAVCIVRGAEIVINDVYIEALRQAVEDRPVKTEGGLVCRPVRRYPFDVLGPATEAEYIAFKASSVAVSDAQALQLKH
jgi:hypothetical protein